MDNNEIVSSPEPTTTIAGDFLALIERVLRDKTMDVDRLERVFGFQERLMEKQAEIEFREAKARIKKAMLSYRIYRSKSVRFNLVRNEPEKGQREVYRYAPLEKIDEVMAPLLAAERMEVSYTTRPREGGGAVVIGTARHVKGHSEESEMSLPLDTSDQKNNLQAMGSTISYARRYIKCNLFDIVIYGDDTDGILPTPITPEQVTEILEKIQLAKYNNLTRFLAYVQAEPLDILEAAVATIPSSSYAKAIATLDRRIRQVEHQ